MRAPGECDPVSFVDLPTITGILSQPNAVATRYGEAIRRYLERRFGPDIAEDIAHDMVVKILEGKIEQYDRAQGPFRPWLRTCATNLVLDYFRARRHQVAFDEALVAEATSGAGQFTEDQESRDDYTRILRRAADKKLKRFQEKTPDNLFHSALRLLEANADAGQSRPNYPAVAAALGDEAGHAITEVNARTIVHRARVKYAQFLIDEVGETLDDPSPANLVDEIVTIGLFRFLEDHLPPEWTQR